MDLTAVEEAPSAQLYGGFSVRPLSNSVTDYFNIQIQIAGTVVKNASVTIFDSVGRLVASKDVTDLTGNGKSNQVAISASSMPTGVYTVVIASGADIVSCRMILTD